MFSIPFPAMLNKCRLGPLLETDRQHSERSGEFIWLALGLNYVKRRILVFPLLWYCHTRGSWQCLC